MMIRDGFVTNSSSTNFIIVSKKELTTDYLIKKLGFTKSSKIYSAGYTLAEDIIRGAGRGLRWFEFDEINYANVLEAFGEGAAKKYQELDARGFHTYLGYTSSDDSYLTSFMTMDNFLIDEADFYMNGLNCVW
jgi:hypothetical protein